MESDGSLPVVRELRPAPDAWEAFRRLSVWPWPLFLDSALRDPARGRYSYIAACPFEVLRGSTGDFAALRPASPDIAAPPRQEISRGTGDPFSWVASRLEPWRAAAIPELPPFQGGAAGVFGYGLSRAIERLPAPRRDDLAVPPLLIGLYDWVLAFDHAQDRAWIVAQGFPETTPRDRLARAERRVEEVLALLGAPEESASSAVAPPPGLDASALEPSWPVPGPPGLRSCFSRDSYIESVARAIEYIRAGDIFQVNLSQRLVFPQRSTPLELYGRLRQRNPAPFAGYLDAGDAVIASSSPEQFLALSGGEVVTRPIKGTRPRGYTPEADAHGGEALRESEKDRSENVMIVDLLRNDLSRVSKPHSVVVPRLFETERFATVHHLVSEVRGRLRDGLGALDLLRATFPGGSITGAPKVRAMEIIAELEPTARGPYCGSLGWIGFQGDMSLNILIRTITAAHGWLQLPVGGGIVALSNPAVEHQETLHKAQGMLRALEE